MFKKVLTLFLVSVLVFSCVGCGKKSGLPEYESKQFDLSGLWFTNELSEATMQLYKDVGFTTFSCSNHSLEKTSENQYYLGSERTMKALELCRKLGLNAAISYGDWIALWSEGEGYYTETPFSQFDIYGDYKDIIVSVGIVDEPSVEHFEIYGNKTLIEDFKKVYPNADYSYNLIPITAMSSRGFNDYGEMMKLVEETFMEPFEKPCISVDVYPFHEGMTADDGTMALNYNYIAESAKKYNIKPAYILQASLGNEFEKSLSESDLRWEIYNALAFGADKLEYYCYSVPQTFNEDGTVDYMYDSCILKQDDTPSDIYYSLQKLHKEIQSFASVILSYDWDKTIGVSGTEDQTFRVASLEYDFDASEYIKLDGSKNYVDASGTQDMLVSRFKSEKYGEAYMFLNWADRDASNTISAEFKDCSSIAVYGGVGFDGTPEIIKLDENGKTTIELEYGEGVFVVPLA